MKSIICSTITPILDQKRAVANFNIPPPRLNLVSPYPNFTQYQLNMRRKAEIFKYSSFQQNSKTNNFTKKQIYTNLARNPSANIISQYQISEPQSSYSNLVCLSDKLKPTLSTACGVPGPPVILQYDPDVPLYNYNNSNRSYATEDKTATTLYNAYTTNIIEYISDPTYKIVSDMVYTEPPPPLPTFTSSGVLGSLLIGNNSGQINYSFTLSTPVAIWFNGSIGASYGADGNKITKTAPGNFELNIQINSISLEIYYNNNLIKTYNSTTLTPNVMKCSLSTTSRMFYAIQYVGMLTIKDILLETPPDTIYTFKYVANYQYDSYGTNQILDFIKTGIYTNLTSANDPKYINNCSLSSVSPDNFAQSSFTEFIVSS